MRIDRRAVIVTGGDGGVGLADARRFALEGAHMGVAARERVAATWRVAEPFLASDDPAFVTGAALAVDGGALAQL